VGSQLSGHAACILAALANAVAGGVSTARGHDMSMWSALLVGTTIYAMSVGVRFLWSRGSLLPSLKTATLSLALGIVVSAGVDKTRAYNHRQELTAWYQALPEDERQQVREAVRHWMEKRSAGQRTSLEEAAQVMGYEFAEDYVVLNYCTPSNKGLVAIWENARAGGPRTH
jgi:hypothetical protein